VSEPFDPATYPLFAPPIDLAEKHPADWTKAEAKRYFEWLMSVIAERVAMIKSVLGLRDSDAPEDVLGAAGNEMAGVLRLPGVSTAGRTVRSVLRGHEIESQTGPLLSVVGYALAADLGLLVAALLRQNCPDLQWEIVQKPKSDAFYNKPVLRPFGAAHMDPIQVSVNVAHQLLDGSRPASGWRDVYSWWRDHCGPLPGADSSKEN
jgi:hypothetical protein